MATLLHRSNNNRDPAAIIRYYLDYLSQQRHPLNEAKMVLVGQGAVGKTSLVNRLTHNTFDPQESKTEGIAITRWEIANERVSESAGERESEPASKIQNPESKIHINIWDFGGQEIMHATHQFFLTKRTLYLLVLDARQAEADNRLDYWLQIIASFGGDSPIIIVGNKTDQQRLDIDQAGLRRRYPHVKAIVETSCATGAGIAELQNAIAQATVQLPHVFNELLAAWFDVKAQLEAMDADYITFEHYTALCQQANVANPDSQRTLLGFLHDLGVVLCFQDDPRLAATHILNPEWVTRGVYAILNHQPLLQHGGILARAMLSDILDPRRYPWLKHLFIIDMMRKFELCFDLEGEKDERFLIPDLLPKTAPDIGDWQDSLGFRYQYTVLPGSILTRLIVRMHPYLDPARTWRTGAGLIYGENHALVRADMHQQRINIHVNGPARGRRTLLGIIRSHFDYIHRTIPNLQVTEQVPLPGHPDIVEDYAYLLDLEDMGETTFIPRGLRERVNIRELLDGVRYKLPSSVGLSPSLAPLLRATLLRCPVFASDIQLHALFTDARLHPWRNTIPETAASREARVDALIDYLYDKQNRHGENALVLLLHVLAARTNPGDALHAQLLTLAAELESHPQVTF